ncbi:MAG: DUF4440 domain-containing protein [Terrimesophilobacter sp.]
MMNSDSAVIDRIATTFYASFASPDHGLVDLTELRGLFHHGAVIVKLADGIPAFYSVESFIAPREELLNSGRLLGFLEEEVSAETQLFDDIAQRWSLYRKSGSLDGAPYSGWGRKSIQLVRSPDGWRISAISWCDGPEGVSIPSL